MGGVTNSRPSDKTGTAGIDTVRFRHRLDGGNYERFGRLQHRDGPRRERWVQVDGVRVGAYPDGLVYSEARGAVFLEGGNGHGLVSAAGVSEAARRSAELLLDLGLDAESDPRVGRCDLTTDLRLEDGRDGQALLRAASYVDLPWLKAGTEGSRRTGLESVLWRSVNGRSVHLRLYDKGVESGLAAPGRWLRLERQIRWRKGREQRVSALASQDLGELFRRRYIEALSSVGELVVCNRDGALEELRRRQRAGEIHPSKARRLAGLVVLGDDGLPRRTSYRWWAELRALGIVLDLHANESNVVRLADYVDHAARAWAA
jgi:hypothetical protein